MRTRGSVHAGNDAALALSGSIVVLAAAVVVKSALFAVFEKRLPRLSGNQQRKLTTGSPTSKIPGELAIMTATSRPTKLVNILPRNIHQAAVHHPSIDFGPPVLSSQLVNWFRQSSNARVSNPR